MNFEQFLSSIPHKFTPEEEKRLLLAFDYASEAHEDQTRASGEPYINHPLSAGVILGEIFPDTESIIATILHDVPENTKKTLDDIRLEFGDKVAELVDGVTKLSNVRLHNVGNPQFLENLRKLFIATGKDVRVMLIKLADRLHNMRTLQFLPPEKQKRIAMETLEVYAPIASRLGIGAWQGELEDLAFAVVDPDRWRYVKDLHTKLLAGHEQDLEIVKNKIHESLTKENVSYQELKGRVKRVYSLHKKLLKPSYKDQAHKVADTLAFRVITDSLANCYAVLGAIHQHFEPIPGTFDDYIALPKPSGYQSLHTTIRDADGRQAEIQIRTDLMHEQAERGVAAHWFYTESGKKSHKIKTDLSWVRELRAWQDHEGDSEELLETLKLDLFSDRIFVRTPQGDIVNLPENSTPIDFAFAVHSNLGFYMTGAKINGKMSSIYHELAQGDMVEILKSKQPVKISPDWLSSVKTSHAKNQIKKYLAGLQVK